MISLPENCCFSVEIKKIIGYFRFHNNTSASFRDQTVQKIRNFEMSRSLKPINDAPEFEINGIIVKIACNGFIFSLSYSSTCNILNFEISAAFVQPINDIPLICRIDHLKIVCHLSNSASFK